MLELGNLSLGHAFITKWAHVGNTCFIVKSTNKVASLICNPSAVAVERLSTLILTHPSALHDDLPVISYVASWLLSQQIKKLYQVTVLA